MSENNNLPKPFTLVIGATTSIIAFVTVIVGFILLWQGNTKIVSSVVTIIGLVALWGSFFYLRYAMKPTQTRQGKTQIGHRKRKKKENHLFSEKFRRWALAGIYVLPLITLLGFGTYYYRENQPSDKIVVLIADFDGRDPKKYGVTPFFIEKISEITQSMSYVSIKPISKPITAAEGFLTANKVGEENKANIVIWGWYVVSNQNITVTYHIVLTEFNFGLGVNAPDDDRVTMQSPINRVESFEFQSEELSDNLTLDTLIAIFEELVFKGKGTKNDITELEKTILNYVESNSDTIENREHIISNLISARALIFLKDGDPNKALLESNRALEIAPTFETYMNRAAIHDTLGNDAAVFEDIKLALTSKPSSPENIGFGYSILARKYYEAERFSDVVQIVNEGLFNIELCSIEWRCHVLYFYRGLAYLELGDSANAKNDFEIVKNLINDSVISNQLDTLLAGSE